MRHGWLLALALWLVATPAQAQFSFERTDFPAPGANRQALMDVAFADLGGANGTDIVVSAYALNKLLLLRNQGGQFAAPVQREACGAGNDGPWQIVSGQLNVTADQFADIGIACGSVTVVPGDGAGDLGAPQPTMTPARGSLALGELTGGGGPELIFGAQGLGGIVLCFIVQPVTSQPFCGNPSDPQPPFLQNVQSGPRPGTPTPIAAELTSAGPRYDEVFGLSTTDPKAFNVYGREPGNGYNSWTSSARVTSTDKPYFVDVGDVEPDGDNDVLVGHLGGGVFDLFVFGPGGILPGDAPKVTNTLGFDNQAGRLADFDGDGRLDVVIAGGQGVLVLHKGNGNGTFGAAQPVGIVGSGSNVALEVGDLNADQRPDIAVVERHALGNTADMISVLINTTPASTPPPGGGSGPPPSTTPLASPATGIGGLKPNLTAARNGRVVLGTATNPPTASTSQSLVRPAARSAAARRRLVLGRSRTTVPAGATRRIVVKLGRKGLRQLRRARTMRVRLTIRTTGPTGLTATVQRSMKLKARR